MDKQTLPKTASLRNTLNLRSERPHDEKFKMQRKRTEDMRSSRDRPHSWIGRINMAKIAIFPKLVYRFSTTPIKILTSFFTEIERNNSKIHRKAQNSQHSQNNHKQMGKCLRYYSTCFNTIELQ